MVAGFAELAVVLNTVVQLRLSIALVPRASFAGVAASLSAKTATAVAVVLAVDPQIRVWGTGSK